MDRSERRRKAFEAVAMPHLDGLYRFALLWTGDAAEAEEAVIGGIVSAFRRWTNLMGRVPLPVLLYGALRDEVGEPAGAPAGLGAPAYENAAAESEPGPGGSALVWEAETSTLVEIGESVRALPAAERDVLLLRVAGRLSYREIAAVTGRGVAEVAGTLGRARQSLQRRLLSLLASPN